MEKRKEIYIVMWLICSFVLPMKAQIRMHKGDKEFKNFNYAFAVSYYKKIADKKEPGYELSRKLADSYRMMGMTEESEKWYAKTVSFPDSDPENLFYYAEALRSNGNYMEARRQFLLYSIKKPQERKKAEAMAGLCETALEWMTNPTQVKVENRKDLNTKYNEFSPVLSGNKILFTTDRKFEREEYAKKEIYGWTGNPYLAVVSASLDSVQQFTVNGKVNELDNFYHTGPAALSQNGDTIYFTRAQKVRNPRKFVGKEKVDGFVNRLEIYYAVLKNGKWDHIQPFPYNDKVRYSVGHPAISADGNILYFASDMPGSIGGSDIFYCEKNKDGSWAKPVNLGAAINTSGKELFPSITSDGTLYFSSDGREGMGGLDLFKAKGSKTKWKEIENMKYPLNSSRDDFGMIVDSTGKSGFFSSNREGGAGGDDIYYFRNPACVVSGLTLEVLDRVEQPLSDVMLELYKKGDTSSIIAFERTSSESIRKVCLRSYQPCAIIHDAEGTFHFTLQPGIYDLKVSKKGYFTQIATVEANCAANDTIKVALELKKIILNKPIVLKDLFYDDDRLFIKRNIYYDLNKADIRYDAAMELDKLIEVLKNNPDIKIELSAHTDSRHTEEYNLNLSQRRAESAVNYIISKGVDKGKIVAKGYGESQLVNRCKDGVVCNEEEHQRNRRTEIKVTEISEPETHVVGPYETLYAISRKYNLSVEDLKKMNDLDSDIIYPGDVLKVVVGR